MQKVKTWNQKRVKKGNKYIVLDKIIESSPISRASIAQETGLNKGTVSSLVNELLKEELIYESGPGKSSGGRRPVLLLFNDRAGYAIGVDVGVNYLQAILTDLNGNIIEKNIVYFSNVEYNHVISKLSTSIDELIFKTPPSPYGIVGIGIGVPGIVNNNGEIVLAPNLNWHNIQLKKDLFQKFQIPIIIENEANAGAYGEKHFGASSSFKNIAYVSIGIGIGVGIILNNELYRGHDGFSGEFGHMTIEVNGSSCTCGSKGCWELYASERALLNHAQEVKIKNPEEKNLSLETIVYLAEQGDKETLHLLNRIGSYIGVGIKNIFNIFNPEQVIIGNRINLIKKWIEPSINKQLVNQTLWPNSNHLQINFSSIPKYATALGMTVFTIEHFLKNYSKV